MSTVFKFNHPGQTITLKNPVDVKNSKGGTTKIGYARGQEDIIAKSHPEGCDYPRIQVYFKTMMVDDPALVKFLKSYPGYTNSPTSDMNKIWIENADIVAKERNNTRELYIESISYIKDLSYDKLVESAFILCGTKTKKNINELKDALYTLADENPNLILNHKDKAIDEVSSLVSLAFNQEVIRLFSNKFILDGDSTNILFAPQPGTDHIVSLIDFLKSKAGKDALEILRSKVKFGEEPNPEGLLSPEDLVQNVKGIGKSVSNLLLEVGIITVKDLAEIDAEELDAKIKQSGKRIPTFVKLDTLILKAKQSLASD